MNIMNTMKNMFPNMFIINCVYKIVILVLGISTSSLYAPASHVPTIRSQESYISLSRSQLSSSPRSQFSRAQNLRGSLQEGPLARLAAQQLEPLPVQQSFGRPPTSGSRTSTILSLPRSTDSFKAQENARIAQKNPNYQRELNLDIQSTSSRAPISLARSSSNRTGPGLDLIKGVTKVSLDSLSSTESPQSSIKSWAESVSSARSNRNPLPVESISFAQEESIMPVNLPFARQPIAPVTRQANGPRPRWNAYGRATKGGLFSEVIPLDRGVRAYVRPSNAQAGALKSREMAQLNKQYGKNVDLFQAMENEPNVRLKQQMISRSNDFSNTWKAYRQWSNEKAKIDRQYQN